MTMEAKKRGRPKVLRPKVKVTMMMAPGLKVGLEDWAAEKGVGYQTLAQELLADAVADHDNWNRAERDPIMRYAGLGYDLRQLLDLAENAGELPPEVQALGEDVRKHLRRARRAIMRMIREAPKGGTVHHSVEEVRERRRAVLERAAQDPEAPLVEVEEDV